MKFMLMMNVKHEPYQVAQWAPEDITKMVGFMNDLNRDLKAAGKLVFAEGLEGPDKAKLVRAGDDGAPSVTDGPFAESKEFIAGFWVVDVKDADEAYRIAARASSSPGPGGKPMNMPIEVRQVGEAPRTGDGDKPAAVNEGW
jgi:hypothetical protein